MSSIVSSPSGNGSPSQTPRPTADKPVATSNSTSNSNSSSTTTTTTTTTIAAKERQKPKDEPPVTVTVPSPKETSTTITNTTIVTTAANAANAANAKGDDKTATVQLVPLTYYPLATQATLIRNMRRLAGKPYAKYLCTSMRIYSDATEAIRAPMPQSGYLPVSQAAKLLDPGYHAHENGWLGLDDGGAYVASRTRFGKQVTGDMIRWWFWWHSVESERYALWFPHCHARVVIAGGPATDRALLEDRAAPHVRKWLGATHRVTEHIGAKELSVHLRFVDPATYGLAWDKLREAGYEAAVCAEVRDGWEPRLKIGDFVHLWRRDARSGHLELRSRYWFGNEVRLDLPGGLKLPLDLPARLLGIKRMRAGPALAYEHFIHDQTEFTNLAGFLPALYADWMAGRV